jgi:hypothetical protein
MPQKNLAGPGERITVHTTNDLRNAVIIPNSTAQDANLSWAARGLLLFMLSQPINWQFHENDLVNRSPMGRDHLRSVVRELEAAGYLRRSRMRKANGVLGGPTWHVWATPQSPESTTNTDISPATGNPTTENPSQAKTRVRTGKSPKTGKPTTENPSLAPTTGNPSLVPTPENPSLDRTRVRTGKPPKTGKPTTENPSLAPATGFPSTYKENNLPYGFPVESNKPLSPPSLREGPPLSPAEGCEAAQERAGEERAPRAALTTHSRSTNICTTDLDSCSPSETPSRPVKAPEQPPGCTDAGTPSRGGLQGRTGASPLPAYAEPYREQLITWQRARQQRHKVKPEKLSTRSLSALAYASQLGVLEEFTSLAAEAGWLSLGFNGYRAFIDDLLAEQNGERSRSCSGTLGSRQPATSRQEQACRDAVAKLDAMANGQITNPFAPFNAV